MTIPGYPQRWSKRTQQLGSRDSGIYSIAQQPIKPHRAIVIERTCICGSNLRPKQETTIDGCQATICDACDRWTWRCSKP